MSDLVAIVERPAHLRDDDEYQLVTAKRGRAGIVPRERLPGSAILTKTQFWVEPGDFLISRRQIIHGACGIVPESLSKAIVSNEYVTLRTKGGLESEFLRLLSHTPHFQKTCFHSSVGVDVEKMVFKIDAWLRFRMPLPPLREQQRITEALAKTDLAVTSAQAVVDQAEKLKRALVGELFTRGIPGRHQRLRSGELGDLPDSWRAVPIGTVADTFSGGTPSRSNPNNFGGKIPWLKSGEIRAGHITSTEETITDLGLSTSAAKMAPAGSVVLAMYGATAGVAGRLEIDAAINQAILAFLPSTSLDPGFLLEALRHTSPTLLRKVQGSGQPNLSAGLVKAAFIPLPPIEEQREIAAAIGAVADVVRAGAAVLAAAKAVRAGLGDELMTGKTRVPA